MHGLCVVQVAPSFVSGCQNIQSTYSADDGRINIWNLTDVSFLQTLFTGQGPVTDLLWLPSTEALDGGCLISSGADGTIKLWKMKSKGVSAIIRALLPWISCDWIILVSFCGNVHCLRWPY
jgi:WD40 repeat protein